MVDDPVVLVTGAGGQVGRSLVDVLPEARYLDRAELDVTDPVAVQAAFEGTEVIVHLAAMTAVDDCEIYPERAWAVNAEGTKNVVEAAASRSARVVYLSTDYVFDGSQEAYGEDDLPRPLNRYGASKLEGERHVLGLDERGLVVRTSWVIGPGRNFVRTILERARETHEVPVVEDQVGRPTFAAPLARALVELIHADRSGIVHVAGDGPPCSWADLADAVLAATGSGARVQRVTTLRWMAAANRIVAPRPPRSVLALERARSWGVPLLDWRDSLSTYVETLS